MDVIKIGSSWPLIKVKNVEKDEEIDRAIFASEPFITKAVHSAGVLKKQSWNRIVGMLSMGWCAPNTILDRYQARIVNKYQCINITVNANFLLLRRMTAEQMADDIARAFLVALRDALKRRRVNVTRLDDEIAKLGPPKATKTAFLNLLGDIRPHREEEVLSGKEVVLTLPLSGTGVPTVADINYIEKMEDLLERRLKSAGAVDGHEAGDGLAEIFLTCDTHGPVIDTLRDMVSKGELPKTSSAVARYLDTDSERVVSLKTAIHKR